MTQAVAEMPKEVVCELPLESADPAKNLEIFERVYRVVRELRREQSRLASFRVRDKSRDECVIAVVLLEEILKVGRVSAKSLASALINHYVIATDHAEFIHQSLTALKNGLADVKL